MQVNFGNFDREKLEKNYLKACEDEKFKKLTARLSLPDDVLMKHTSKLIESATELKNCESCHSLHECQNSVEGFVYFPVVYQGHLQFDSVACRYKRAALKREEMSCNYYDMPASLRNASMKDIDISDKKRVATIKWLKNFYDDYPSNHHKKGLYLTGSFGSGKTYLTCAMLNELAKKGADIIIVYYPELLRSLKESLETDFGKRMDKLKKCDILFLDDIGAEPVTPWARDEILGTILQYRMDAILPTFFTSNLSLEELDEHLSSTKNSVEKVKSRRIIERIKQLTETVELISQNRRN